jgi:hypothetical protein
MFANGTGTSMDNSTAGGIIAPTGSRFAGAVRKTQLVNRFASRSGTFSALTKDQIEDMKREIEAEDARLKAEKAAREAEREEQMRLLIAEQKQLKEAAEAVAYRLI